MKHERPFMLLILNSQVVKEKISFAHKNLRDLYKWSKFNPFNEWLENNNYRYFLDFSKNPQEDKIKEVIAKWESFAKSKIIDISKDKLVNYQYLGRQESMIANNENQQNIQKILNKPESEITLHELIVLVKFIEKSN